MVAATWDMALGQPKAQLESRGPERLTAGALLETEERNTRSSRILNLRSTFPRACMAEAVRIWTKHPKIAHCDG
jgi:hypothetical protein